MFKSLLGIEAKENFKICNFCAESLGARLENCLYMVRDRN